MPDRTTAAPFVHSTRWTTTDIHPNRERAATIAGNLVRHIRHLTDHHSDPAIRTMLIDLEQRARAVVSTIVATPAWEEEAPNVTE